MPRGDGTGPCGLGPQTGRGRGPCRIEDGERRPQRGRPDKTKQDLERTPPKDKLEKTSDTEDTNE